ncbi:MAG: galactokinase family protein [Propioniciclava sp.]|uniref:galactokinase n=1 Tax=Propioniciclava sp. TaxID=2038686 RepID=UPI0039E30669
MESQELVDRLNAGDLDARIAQIYAVAGPALAAARARLTGLAVRFADEFPGLPAALFTAAGRTEMGGNHTDHQHGQVLAGSVSVDMIACGGPNGTDEIRVRSEGYPEVVVRLGDLEPNPAEHGSSESLVRGVARALTDRGFPLAGASLCVVSSVPGGSGLSSSASYEILIGVALNHLFCGGELSAVELAQIGQYAENVFFGKPSGLMDQMACSVGGVVHIDFADPAAPVFNRVEVDLAAAGHVLCIIDSGADHADLTDEYSAITAEMRAAAACFGAEYLSQVDPDAFWARLDEVRRKAGDRAALRAIHFFEDNARVPQQAAALAQGRFGDFLGLVTASGISSATHLQNLYAASHPAQQAVGITIALAQRLLDGRGAVRVHGGGFAGTVQAYVPVESADAFKAGMDAVLGEGACQVLSIRPIGGGVIAG